MYGSVDMMVIREHHAEIRREVAANRLDRKLRSNRGANRDGRSHLLADVRWELQRHAGLFMKRLRTLR